MKNLGLYIHVPFCANKCAYCDFYSVAKASEKTHEEYAKALLKQIKEYGLAAGGRIIDTIYIGGGTPVIIGTELLGKIIKGIYSCFDIAKNLEFSIEANPGIAEFDLKSMKKLRKIGINRLSLGLQSIHVNELKNLTRQHDYKDFLECYNNARSAGFDNINIDLMYGIPGQNLASFKKTLEKVCTLDPEHISAYGLKIEPGTFFYKNLEKVKPFLPDEEAERLMYFSGCEFLESKKYKQYEISNFAKGGLECRHNLKYWTCSEYIGLGTGAHSYFGGCRFSFKKNIKEYIRNFNYEKEKLANLNLFDGEKYDLFDENIEIKPIERIGEYIMMGLRLNSGINRNDFTRLFYKDFDELYYKKIEPFLLSGHMVRTLGGYALTREGMFVSNYILSRIIDF